MVSLFGNQLIISTQRQVNRVYPRGLGYRILKLIPGVWDTVF